MQRSYHEHQSQQSWQYHDEAGNLLDQRVTPLDRVGIYVSGGKASYPSSVLMSALPAKGYYREDFHPWQRDTHQLLTQWKEAQGELAVPTT